MQNNKIYENYKKTIAKAITKAVEITKNQDPDVHVEIFMNTRGYVHISEIMSSNTSDITFGTNDISICSVDGWEENLLGDKFEDLEDEYLDAHSKYIEIEEEIEYKQVIKDYLFYD